VSRPDDLDGRAVWADGEIVGNSLTLCVLVGEA
jgi:hypothetical protein